MNDRDFEQYMSDLSRLLRLGRAQRAEIHREIEAHVADALADLAARGVPRQEALRQVLDDFGDAAELAARFSQLGRKRRWIMHGTAIAACIGFALVIGSFMAAPVAPPTANAAGLPDEAAPRLGPTDPATDITTADDNIRRALSRNVSEIAFDNVPLFEVIEWLTTLTAVNVHVQWSVIESANIARDRPIQLRLKNVSVERVLRLVFDEIQDAAALEYEVQEGVLLISTREALSRNLAARVYDVRDILQRIDAAPRSAANQNRVASSSLPLLIAYAQQQATGGAGAPAPTAARADENTAALAPSSEELQRLLCDLIAPESWVDNGGAGQIRELRGVLVVRQTESVHRELERLLASLREVLK